MISANLFYYLYEYIGECEMFNEIQLPKKEEFYSNLNMEDITDSDYNYVKKILQWFWNKKIKWIL